ncbi:MAG: hypothetical protein AAF191_01075, partial [Verrucomicrobiota bacterium]
MSPSGVRKFRSRIGESDRKALGKHFFMSMEWIPRVFLALASLCGLITASSALADKPSSPNIIIIFIDDMGY